MAKVLTSRDENYAQWYNDLVIKADLAENSAVRGCMVIKPYGYAIWERIQGELDRMFKEAGHVNAYFPLLIPKSFFSREAAHVEGFAKECAVVTHYRLTKDDINGGLKVDPSARLEEELVIRPTSETIIWNTYKNWIQSYRDLPILVNQWSNVVRWEMRTRLFLRTAEFLWQEGHTAHETRAEAEDETLKILDIYSRFAEEYIGVPVIKGRKTESEKFAGAVDTYCIEALMQDGKALQAGTSHFLGQNFAKAFDVMYTSKDGKQEYVWATSWGVSTRLMGALVMAHSDDNGLVLPPRLAPQQVVIIPIYKTPDEYSATVERSHQLKTELQQAGITVKVDDRDTHKPGWKFAEYELKGVPLRIAVGPRDLINGTAEIVRRDTLAKDTVPLDGIGTLIPGLLGQMQTDIFQKALAMRSRKTYRADSWDEFLLKIEEGGFILAHWDGTPETEQRIKEETKATIRCIPMGSDMEAGVCIRTGKPSRQRVLFARAY